MKKVLFTLFILSAFTEKYYSQCTSQFTFSAVNEQVYFTNQSTLNNAHYFWNFGDGTGSGYKNPVHKYPESGTYFVSLYIKDTISNCSNFFEAWVVVTKLSADPCISGITDSIFTFNGGDNLKVKDSSMNCNAYSKKIDGGPALNMPYGNWISLGNFWQNMPFRMVSRMKYFAPGNVLKRSAYKSSFHKYLNAKHYTACSANFEFLVVSETQTNQRILFKAMNNSANSYSWTIAGFGNPITSVNDTISKVYPKGSVDLWQVGLYTIGQGGCRDSLWQNIRIQDSSGLYTTTDVPDLAHNNSFKAYPNPFNENITFQFPATQQNATFLLYDNLGRLVKEISISDHRFLLEREKLLSGVYFFLLKSSDNRTVSSGKIIAE